MLNRLIKWFSSKLCSETATAGNPGDSAPREEQTYLIGTQGAGTTLFARAMRLAGDERPVVDGWDGKSRIEGPAIITSNLPRSLCAIPEGADFFEIKRSRIQP